MFINIGIKNTMWIYIDTNMCVASDLEVNSQKSSDSICSGYGLLNLLRYIFL